jgi:polysaccharide chain length determinant protein (PEP-CTERM system associated)
MLPGKKYKPEDFAWMLWHRKWFILIPTVVAAVGTFVWSSRLPDRYASTVTVLIVPQRVPESYVRSTVTASVAERLGTISQEITSRTRLERIIEEFNLYPQERRTMIMEDVIELMRRRDIEIGLGRARRGQDTNSFTVRFAAQQPRLAMQVADRLASMFQTENIEDRAALADNTNQFLQAQLEDSKRRLQDHEKKLEAFRQRNAGQLPSQMQSNLQMMQMTQSQIQNNLDAMSRDQNQLTLLEGLIADAVASVDQPLGGGGATAPSAASGERVISAADQLAAARAQLRELETRYRPTHPEVERAKREITRLEARANEEAARAPRPDGNGAPQLTGAAASKVAQMRIESERLRQSIQARKADDTRLKNVLAAYRARTELTPRVESEMTELMRDYDTLQTQYRSLLQKSEEAKIAVNLERRQIGEQFKIIESARLPERPISPDRQRLNLIGLFSGLALGLALVALLEYRDTKLRTDDDVVTSLALPVIAVIPVMTNNTERQRSSRRRLVLGASTAVVVTLAIVAIILWQSQLLRAWVR